MASTNASIVGAFLKETNDFEQFTPANSQQLIAAVTKNPYSPLANQFYNLFQPWLVQRIGQVRMDSHRFEHPLKEFKGATMPFGNTVENIMYNYAEAYSYDDDAETLLKRHVLDGKVQFVSVDRRDKIPVTINRAELQSAFVDEYGLNRYVNAQIEQAYNTDDYIEWAIMKSLPAQADKETPLYRYPAYDSEPTTKEQAEDFLTDLQAIADYMTLPNYGAVYTPAKIPTVARPEDCVLLIKAEPKAAISVKAYANFFNIDEGKAPFRIIFVDDFGIEGCFAALTTKFGYIANDTVYTTRVFDNPETLEQTYYLHHWELLGINYGAPWILFGTGENWNATSPITVTQSTDSLTLTADKTTVEAGGEVQLTLTLGGTLTADSGETPAGLTIAPDAATYEISATSDNTPAILNSRTYVEPATGVLHVQKSMLKTGDKLTITSTSIKDTTKTATVEITIA